MRPFQHITILFFACLGVLVTGWYLYNEPLWFIMVLVLVYVHVLVLGSIFIRWNFYMHSYHQGTRPNEVALSFDDGPAAETEAILDILKEQQVAAAFFTIGKRAFANPQVLQRWDAEGHVIGNHSYHHGFNFDWQSARRMQDEIRETNEAVKQATGRTPRLFRPPYGVTNPNLAKAVKRSGMYSIGWSLRSFDTKAKDKDALLHKILDNLRSGDIILLHDSMGITREILTDLIVAAREKGFTFVRIDKMLDLPAYE